MSSNLIIALLAGIGSAGWIYSKIQRSTGGNTSNSLIVAGSSGAALAFVLYVILGMIF